MDQKTATNPSTKRTFRWGVSSTDIRFAPPSAPGGTREGCNCSDCSAVSPLPVPKPQGEPAGQERP